MQNWKVFKFGTWICRSVLLISFFVAILQNFYFQSGIVIGPIKLTQFYSGTYIRLIPLLWVSFFLIPTIAKILEINPSKKFYLSEFLIASLVCIDGFTHISNIYSLSFILPLYGEIWFDKIMHFAEGIMLTAAIFPLLESFTFKYMSTFKSPSLWALWMTAAFISIFFVSWEIVELYIDRAYDTTLITSKYDTNEDLMFAYLGILCSYSAIWAYRTYKNFSTDLKPSLDRAQ
jgi:hypothetical protein